MLRCQPIPYKLWKLLSRLSGTWLPDDGCKAIVSIFDEITLLRRQIKPKDAEITILETKLENRPGEELE
jgi:hypothetical protein